MKKKKKPVKQLSKRERNKRSLRRQLDKIYGSTRTQNNEWKLIGRLLGQDLEMKMCGYKPVALCKIP